MAAGALNVAPGTPVQVRPRDASGRPKKGWQATLVHGAGDLLVLRAPMQHPAELGYVTFAPDDTVVERYWLGRWYNILTLYDSCGRLKGWYANLCTPVTFDGATIRYTDLDLDLWVWPDRRFLVLDEDEFVARVESAMPPAVVQKARGALAELLSDLATGGPLFQEVEPG